MCFSYYEKLFKELLNTFHEIVKLWTASIKSREFLVTDFISTTIGSKHGIKYAKTVLHIKCVSIIFVRLEFCVKFYNKKTKKCISVGAEPISYPTAVYAMFDIKNIYDNTVKYSMESQ